MAKIEEMDKEEFNKKFPIISKKFFYVQQKAKIDELTNEEIEYYYLGNLLENSFKKNKGKIKNGKN